MTPEDRIKFIYRSCIDKKSFTEEVANIVVDKFANRGELIYYYKCSLCNAYHLTSNPPFENVDFLGLI